MDVAVVYDRGRPGYPAEAVTWAVTGLGTGPGGSAAGGAGVRVVDVGAGTGKLTAALVAAGLETVAVEPAAGMRKLLKHRVPKAQVLAGSAEELPLPDGSVDLVTAGQAFHWFDLQRALPEIARVLRPGGGLALLYNARDDGVRWVRALAGLVGDFADHASAAHDGSTEELEPLFAFDGERTFRYEQELDAAGLVDLIGSRSYVIRLPDPDRSALLAKVARFPAEQPELVGRQWFSMPYVTSVQRYRLRA